MLTGYPLDARGTSTGIGGSTAMSTGAQAMLAQSLGTATPARRWHLLNPFAWLLVVLVVLATSVVFVPQLVGTAVSEMALVASIAIFFTALVSRLGVAAARQAHRRVPLLLLTAGISLWGVGSAMLSAAEVVTTVTFPSPGEAFFLASYVGMVAFLLTDVPRRTVPTPVVGLEAAVICGATACLAALIGLGPVSLVFGGQGVQLLLALLYPAIDLTLALIVLAQLLVQQRDRSRRTAALLAGFVGLAVADCSFLLALPSDRYVSSVALNLLYAASFAVVAHAAVVRPAEVGAIVDQRLRARNLVLAAGVAVTALTMGPDGPIGWCVTATALVTLLAAGGRLALALHEAQGAAEALRLSRTDELTGLPNRRAVLADLDRQLGDDRRLALMLLDLDGFKDINDSLGHTVGDQVLVLVAHRLQARLRPRLAVARLGGDEFALVALTDDPIEAMELGRVVTGVLDEPVEIRGLTVTVSASLGVALGIRGDTSTDLLRRADVAMYQAKSTRVGCALYEVAQDRVIHQRLRRTEDLSRGIREGELVIWYQPQVNAATQAVLAVEALIRWQHPLEGLLTPAAFLPEARRHGLMPALSISVIRQVVDDARRWVGEGFRLPGRTQLRPTRDTRQPCHPLPIRGDDRRRAADRHPAHRGHRGLVHCRTRASP